jgi:tRNA pseudouridine55 synthase
VLKQLSFRALVSKGTYIRTLAEDIGNLLGCGASLIALRRTRSNQYSIKDAIALENIPNAELTMLKLLGCDDLAQHLPEHYINHDEFEIIKFGNLLPVMTASLTLDVKFRLYAGNSFLGIAAFIERNSEIYLKPIRLLSGLLELNPWC